MYSPLRIARTPRRASRRTSGRIRRTMERPAGTGSTSCHHPLAVQCGQTGGESLFSPPRSTSTLSGLGEMDIEVCHTLFKDRLGDATDQFPRIPQSYLVQMVGGYRKR